MATGEKSARTADTRSSESSTALARSTSAGHDLAKDVFDLAEDPAIFVFVFARCRLDLCFGQRFGELFEQLLLLLGQALRCHALNRHEQIALTAARHIGHAFAAQAEGRSRLGAFGNLDGLVTIEAGHFDLSAERKRGEGQRHRAMQVVAIALEELVLLHEDDHVEIARWSTERSCFTLA